MILPSRTLTLILVEATNDNDDTNDDDIDDDDDDIDDDDDDTDTAKLIKYIDPDDNVKEGNLNLDESFDIDI